MEEKGWPEDATNDRPVRSAKATSTQYQKFGAGTTAGTEGRHGQAQTRTEALAASLDWWQAVRRSHVHARHKPLAQLAVLKTVT